MSTYSSLVMQFPYGGLFALLLLGGVGLPFPEDATLMLCGFLLSQDIVKPVPALITVFLGAIIIDVLIFAIGRRYGRAVVTHPRLRRIITPGRLALLENKFGRWGVLVLLIGRHAPGLRSQLFLAAGVLKMPGLRFLLTDAVSLSLTMAITVGMGYAGGDSLSRLYGHMARFEHAVVLVLVIAVFFLITYRYLRQRFE
jgi:membrane protein DedA with SNARE-associated domain